MKNKIIMSAFAFLLVLSLISFSSAISITNCTDINSAGNYEIVNDINSTGDTNCLTINTDNVLIDGNWHTYFGNPPQQFTYSNGFSNITIQNLNLNNTGFALVAQFGSNYTIKNMYFKEYSDRAIYFYLMDNVLLDNITFYNISNVMNGVFRLRQGNNILLRNIKSINSDFLTLIEKFKVDATNVTIYNFTSENYHGSISIDSIQYPTTISIFPSSSILIDNNSAVVDSNTNPELNVSSHIKLLGLTFQNVKVLRDGVDCPSNICSNLQYSNGVADFDVTGWSNYSLAEAPIVQISESNPNLIHGQGLIFDSLSSVGSGFGIFLQVLGIALPTLLIGLGFVAVMVTIAYSIALVIRKALGE